MRKISELVILFFLLVLISTFSSAQIYLSGSLSGVLEDTTYIVEDSIWVRPEDSLFVLPGAVFLFEGNHTFNIYGYLSAVGTEQDSICFQPIADTLLWGSIIFESGSSHQSALSYCHMTGASASAINCYSVNISISHCTATGNFANWGGGIYCSSANATIEECVVTDNQSVNNGGGIYCTHADPTIINCTVTGNSSNMGGGGSGRGGGGICCNHSSSPVISGCTVGGNYCSENGGGISINDNSHPDISDCDIYDNSADSSGGGIFCCAYSHPPINDCDIFGNDALEGGGLYIAFDCTTMVSNCDIHNNTAENKGGGIYCLSADPNFSYSAITGNSAPTNGGGMTCESSNPTITNCTISRNSAGGDGGGIYETSPSLDFMLVNTIIEGNTGNGGIYFTDSVNVDLTYGDFYGNGAGPFAGSYIPPDLGALVTVNANGDSCDLYYNIFLDPLFLDPGMGDFHLQGGSPCIDAGDPDSPLDPDSTTADIGAYYFDQSAGIKGSTEPEQPESFRILGNYPNPFNSTTTIRFELPVASLVKLEVFDIQGRRIWARGPRPYSAGSHTVQFDGSGLASGIYIYHLQTEQLSARGKMVLLK